MDELVGLFVADRDGRGLERGHGEHTVCLQVAAVEDRDGLERAELRFAQGVDFAVGCVERGDAVAAPVGEPFTETFRVFGQDPRVEFVAAHAEHAAVGDRYEPDAGYTFTGWRYETGSSAGGQPRPTSMGSSRRVARMIVTRPACSSPRRRNSSKRPLEPLVSGYPSPITACGNRVLRRAVSQQRPRGLRRTRRAPAGAIMSAPRRPRARRPRSQ